MNRQTGLEPFQKELWLGLGSGLGVHFPSNRSKRYGCEGFDVRQGRKGLGVFRLLGVYMNLAAHFFVGSLQIPCRMLWVLLSSP